MEWIKVAIKTQPEKIEALAEALLTRGIGGVEIIDPREFTVFLEQDKQAWDYVDEGLLQLPGDDDARVVFYLPADAQGESALAAVRSSLTHFGDATMDTEQVNDESWLHTWKKYFVPIRAGRVVIVPEWESAQNMPSAQHPAEIIFRLDPGSAFGTGQHATTFLCVELLQEILRPGDILLDAGCGSGILAIIGVLLGAKEAVGCDIDPSAVSATRKNAALNGIDPGRLSVLHGNLFTDEKVREVIFTQKYDVITANIVADAVITLIPQALTLLKPGGHLIASGIIDDRAEEVLAAARAASLTVVSDKALDGWHGVCLRA